MKFRFGRTTSTFIIIMIAFTVITSIYTLVQYNRLNEIETDWRNYQAQIDQREKLLSKLKEQVGFGGMIHNFKNYVLRNKNNYKVSANEDANTALATLSEIHELDDLHEDESGYLKDIENTILKYQNNIALLEGKARSSILSKDKMVKVSDAKMLAALTWFRERMAKEKESHISRISTQMMEAKQVLLISALFSLFSFLIVVFILVRRVQNTEDLLEKERVGHVHTARLSAIGQMAGSIAHEINNPLAILQGSAQVIEMCVNKDPIPVEQVKKSTQSIVNTVKRIASVIQGLRGMTRADGSVQKEVIKLDQLIEEVSAICRERCKRHSIELKLPQKSKICFQGQPVQISQVLINLLNNAIDATKGQSEKWIQLEVNRRDHECEIALSNSGPSITKDIREKLMTPFFTTKKHGEGTGIGLSISKNIIEKHSGRLYLDEQSSHTRFVIRLPLSIPLEDVREVRA